MIILGRTECRQVAVPDRMNDQIKRIDGEPLKNKEGDQYQIGGTDQIDGMTGTTVRTKGLVRGVGAQGGRMPQQKSLMCRGLPFR